jgi:amino acid adenylation domain-containing protein
LLADPEQRLVDLPLLSAAETQQLLVNWNQTELSYPQNLLIQQLFEAQVEQTPDKVAAVFEGQQLTYKALNEQANQVAHYLQTLGVGTEKLVGIHLERSLEMVVALLAVLKAGGGYVPLDPTFPQERLNFMLADANVIVLLTQWNLAEQLNTPPQTKVVYMDGDSSLLQEMETTNPSSKTRSEDLAYVIYTSGSTGKPKGIQVQHKPAINFLISMQQTPGLSAADILLSVTTLSFDISVLELLLPLITGARLVVASRETAADGSRLLAELAKSDATVMQATPTTWRMLIDAGWQENDGLKVLCGGEALPPDLAAQLLKRCQSLWNMYGPTETTIWSTVHAVQDDDTIPIGRPIGNTYCYVLDARLQPVPVGVPGELYIGGDGLARGYFNRPNLTSERFIPSPFSDEPGSRMYKTGDLVRYRVDGNIEYIGRIDHQVKIRGFRIEVGEIEAILVRHPSVREAVVVAREDKTGNKSLVGYLILVKSNEPPTVTELRAFLRTQLPDYMVPAAFVFLESYPLTPNKKVNRKALPTPDQARPELGAAFVAPSTQHEEQVAHIWADLLQLEQIGVNDNFFDLGGHSLLATQLIARLHSTFTVDIPLRTVFEKPTVAELAVFIQEADIDGSAYQQQNSDIDPKEYLHLLERF